MPIITRLTRHLRGLESVLRFHDVHDIGKVEIFVPIEPCDDFTASINILNTGSPDNIGVRICVYKGSHSDANLLVRDEGLAFGVVSDGFTSLYSLVLEGDVQSPSRGQAPGQSRKRTMHDQPDNHPTGIYSDRLYQTAWHARSSLVSPLPRCLTPG